MIKQVFDNQNFKLMSLIIRERNTEEELGFIRSHEADLRSQEFLDVATEHELVSTICSKLEKKTGIQLGGKWEEEMIATRNRLGFLFAKVEEIGKDLAAHNIPLILLKNGGIAIDIMVSIQPLFWRFEQ